MCAAQGIEFRAPLKTSEPLREVMARLRAEVASIQDDRYLAPDIEAASALIAGATLTQGMGLPNHSEKSA